MARTSPGALLPATRPRPRPRLQLPVARPPQSPSPPPARPGTSSRRRRTERQRAGLHHLTRQLLVVDVEGNGAAPPDLAEVTALSVRNGRPDTSTAGARLIRPPRPVTPFAARAHGPTNATPAPCPTRPEVSGRCAGSRVPRGAPRTTRTPLPLPGARHPPLPSAAPPGVLRHSTSSSSPRRPPLAARHVPAPPMAGRPRGRPLTGGKIISRSGRQRTGNGPASGPQPPETPETPGDLWSGLGSFGRAGGARTHDRRIMSPLL